MDLVTNPLWAVGVSVTVVVFLAWAIHRHVRRGQIATVTAKESAAASAMVSTVKAVDPTLKRLVSEGTHLLDGRLRCQASPSCKNAATYLWPKIIRDEGGLWELVRRFFGAQQRLCLREGAQVDVGPDGEVSSLTYASSRRPRCCGDCIHLVHQDYRLKLAEIEHRRIENTRAEEIDLGDYERVGAAQRIARLVAAHGARDSGEDPGAPASNPQASPPVTDEVPPLVTSTSWSSKPGQPRVSS